MKSDVSRVKEICESSNNPLAEIHKFTGKLSTTAFVPVDGHTSDSDIANFFMSGFAAKSAPIDERSPCLCPQFSREVEIYLETHAKDFEALDSKETYNCEFGIHELERVLRDMKVSTAPGADNLPPWFYAHCGNNARTCILETLNDSFRSGMLPTAQGLRLGAHPEATA